MVSRRHFILAAAIAVGGTAAGIKLYRSKTGSQGELALNEVVKRLAELPGAVRFGNMYRKQQKHSDSVTSVKSVSKRLFEPDVELNQKLVEQALEKQMQTDLAAKQVFLVDDWYLTRIEADLCALASILKDSRL